MELNAILCNYAEVQNNLLYVTGGGIDQTIFAAGAQGPWVVNIGIGINIGVPWMQTNQEHTLTIDLVDADEQPMHVPAGPDATAPFHAEMKFNVGRPPLLKAGDSQSVNLAVNLPGFPIAELGIYSFVLRIDGTELRRLHYRVATQPGLNASPGLLA